MRPKGNVAPSLLFPPLSRSAFREGWRDLSRLSLGITVWGVVTGVAMVRGGMPLGWAIVLGLVAYAGSAQLAVLPLLVSRSPIPVVFFTAFLVNLRFVIFSAAMRREFTHLPMVQRFFAGYVNGDFAFSLFTNRFPDGAADPRGGPDRMGYFWGVAVLNIAVWNGASTLGMLIGTGLPKSWGLDLAATLALVSVMLPMFASVPTAERGWSRLRPIVMRPIVGGSLATAVCSVATVRLPYRLGLVGSMVLGVVVAMGFAQLEHDGS